MEKRMYKDKEGNWKIRIGKRGAVSVEFLIATALLIAAFVIVLIVYMNLNLVGNVDREACHQSVLLRGTLPAFGGVQEYLPLKCKTEKICVTSGLVGGECSDFKDTSGATKVTKAKVSSTDDISKVISQSMLDCWTMMGEGKLSLYSQWVATNYGFGGIYPTCIVCSRIAFDSESLSKLDASKVIPDEYMNTHIIAGKDVTYTDYFAGIPGSAATTGAAIDDASAAVAAAQAASATAAAEQQTDEEKLQLAALQNDLAAAGSLAMDKTPVTLKDLDFKNDEVGVIFTQISAPNYGNSFFTLAATIVGSVWVGVPIAVSTGKFVGKIIPPVGRAAISKIATQTASKLKLGKVAAALAVITFASQQANVMWQRSVAAKYCGEFTSGNAADGCTIVRAVKYNETELATYCSVIESIP